MIVSRKQIFIILNYFCIWGLLISCTDLPFTGLMQKVKFIFIAVCAVDLFTRNRIRWTRGAKYIIGTLIIYTFLWGIVFVNEIVRIETKNHFIMMIYYLALLILSIGEIKQNCCIYEYIESSYYACVTVILMQCVTHVGELVENPLYIIKAIFSYQRVRSSFGFIHTNYAGNICYVAFILSFFLILQAPKNLLKTKKGLLWILFDGICYLVFISTSSRAAILSFFMFLLVFVILIFLDKYDLLEAKGALGLSILFLCGIVVFYLAQRTGLLDFVWSNSNRQLNISENVKYVKQLGNVWTGMGFVENAAFQSRWNSSAGLTSTFGVATSSLDMYYVYLYCTTGIIGCAVIGGILIYMLYALWKRRMSRNGIFYLSMYVSVLFYAFWESVLFTYRFWTMLILIVLIIYKISETSSEVV